MFVVETGLTEIGSGTFAASPHITFNTYAIGNAVRPDTFRTHVLCLASAAVADIAFDAFGIVKGCACGARTSSILILECCITLFTEVVGRTC